MSYQAVEWAIKQAPEVPLPVRMVLVVFAEAADEHGQKAYPSIKTVSQYLCCSERNVSKHVKALVEARLLVRAPDQSVVSHIPADRRPVVYDVPIHLVRSGDNPEPKRRGRKPKPAEIGGNSSSGRSGNGVNCSSALEETGGTVVLNGVNSSTNRGELQYANGGNCSSDNPPLVITPESPVEPPSVVASASTSHKRSPSTRGRRISEDYQPRQEDVEWAEVNHPGVNLSFATPKFVNYWMARGDGKAAKVDWNRAWRNWIIGDSERAAERAARSTSYSRNEPFDVRAAALNLVSGGKSNPEYGAPTISYDFDGETA